MKIGITERGDAAIDLSWSSKMDSVNGAVVITKNCASPDFQNAVRQHKNKLIVHATITGNGGSFIEPNVPNPQITMQGLYDLCGVIDPARIVLRIDPIIPNQAGLSWVPWLINNMPPGIKRVRFSIIDNYKHLVQRGLTLPWQSFNAPEHLVADAVTVLRKYEHTHSIECCGESYPVIPQIWHKGCISDWDLILLGLDFMQAEPFRMGAQRKVCKCLSVKTELLNSKKQCPHGCLYCYWR